MNPEKEATILEELLTRLVELEREHAHLKEVNTQLAGEVAALQSERPDRSESKMVHMPPLAQGKPELPGVLQRIGRGGSRRNVLRQSLTVAASVIGAGTLLEMSTGTAHGSSAHTATDNPGNFSSSVTGVPAITAVATSGADGIDITSANGTALFAQSNTSRGVYATTSGGVPAIEGVANSNLGFGVAGTCFGGYGIVGSTNSGTGVYANSTSGTALKASSSSGPALVAASSSGPAIVANGLVQVLGNAVGQATLLAGKKSVVVNTPAATTNSNILLTPLTNPKNLWVTRAAGSFTINVNTASTSNIVIAYLIIN